MKNIDYLGKNVNVVDSKYRDTPISGTVIGVSRDIKEEGILIALDINETVGTSIINLLQHPMFPYIFATSEIIPETLVIFTSINNIKEDEKAN